MQKFLTTTLISSSLLLANSSNFFTNSQEGWFSYKDDNLTKKDLQKKPINKSLNITIPKNLSQLDAKEFKKLLEDSKSIAVMNPSKSNVKKYIMLQNFMSTKADEFTDTWKEVIIENPELDLSTNASKGKFIRKAKYKEKKRKRAKFWKNEISNIKIAFFYNPDDIEKTLAQDRVMTLLNYELPKLEIIKIDIFERESLVEKLHITIAPDIWMIYKKDGEMIWHRLHAGMVSKDKILDRVDYIYKKMQDVK